jgi:hypothetical protein
MLDPEDEDGLPSVAEQLRHNVTSAHTADAFLLRNFLASEEAKRMDITAQDRVIKQSWIVSVQDCVENLSRRVMEARIGSKPSAAAGGGNVQGGAGASGLSAPVRAGIKEVILEVMNSLHMAGVEGLGAPSAAEMAAPTSGVGWSSRAYEAEEPELSTPSTGQEASAQ